MIMFVTSSQLCWKCIPVSFTRPPFPLPRRQCPQRRCKGQRRVPKVVRPRSLEEEVEGPVLEELDVTSTGGLGGTSEDVFGPLAVLLVGFTLEEFRSFRGLLRSIGADMVNLIPCSPTELGSSLGDTMQLENVLFEEGPMGLRRTVFLSGMYASEVQEVISAYQDMQLPPAVFAAYVPKNKDKKICDLVEEVYEDHEYMIMQRNQNRSNKHT